MKAMQPASSCPVRGVLLGFTLMELMITISIMSIVSAIAVANIARNLPRYRLDRAGSQVTGDLRAARMEAVAKSTRAVVSFSPSEKKYTIWVDANRNGSVDTGERKVRSLTSLRDISMYSYPDTGAFTPRGTFESSYLYCYVAIWSPGAGYKYVYVFPSGQIDPYDASS